MRKTFLQESKNSVNSYDKPENEGRNSYNIHHWKTETDVHKFHNCH